MVGADSLQSIAQRAAGRHVTGIESVGDLPWDLVAPIISKVKSPEQLHRLEQSSPQLIGHTYPIWLDIMDATIPSFNRTTSPRPADPKNWHKLYKKLKKAADAEADASTARLKAVYDQINEKKESNLAKVIAKPLGGMPARRNAATNWRAGWGPSTKNMSASEKIKRQVDDANRARMLRERNQLRLNGQLKQSAYQNPAKVAVAPRQMVEEIKMRNSATSAPPTTAVRVPVRRRGMGLGHSEEERRRPKEAGLGYDLLQDREARLKAMQRGGQQQQDAPRGSPKLQQQKGPEQGNLSLDFLEDDDLFSESEEGGNDDDDVQLPIAKTPTTRKLDALNPAAKPAIGRPVSPMPHLPGPKPAMTAKRKAPPALFMASPAKKARPKV